MKNVLITGVAGFIGSNIAKRFLAEGYYVYGVDDLSQGKLLNIPPGVDFIECDLSNGDLINLLPKKCQKILHLAGQSSGEISFDNPVLDLHKNTSSTLQLIDYGIQASANRLIYASSMSVYGNYLDKPVSEKIPTKPLSCYGVGKTASESYLRIYKNSLPYVSMRMFNVYGPGQDIKNLRQGMVSIYVSQALNNKKIKVKGSLDRYRDFIFIDDVVESWFRASVSEKAVNQTINIGTGVKTSVEDLIDEICKLLPSSYFVEGNTPGDQNGIYADISHMNNVLEYIPKTSLSDGLDSFIDWASRSFNKHE